MKPAQFYLLIILGAACLVLSIVGMAVTKSNQHLQSDLQAQQEEINRGSASQQMRTSIIKDIAQAALEKKDNTLKEVLGRAGFTVTANPSPASPLPDGASSPAASSSPNPSLRP